jgi:N-acetylmuramoyl-L-alanine amidase
LFFLFPLLMVVVLITALLPSMWPAGLLEVWDPAKGPPVLVIDPGHGGIDGGASGAEGMLEKEINLHIAKKLKQLFEINGFCVIMTREDDRSIHDSGLGTIGAQKSSDLRNRLAIVNRTPNAVLLSIHQNYFPISRYWGAQVFYGAQNEQSRQLAQAVQDCLREMIQPDNERQIKKSEENLFLLHQVKAPAVMIECGFLSNREECVLLNDSVYQEKIAFAIFTAFLQYLRQDGM